MLERSQELEIIDQGAEHYTPEEYDDCLYKLDKIGRFLGGDRANFLALQKLRLDPRSILDVGCGGGLFAISLSKSYPKARIVGIDIAEDAIAFARKQLHKITASHARDHISFVYMDSKLLRYDPESFDVVMSTLMCHHLTDEGIVKFLKQAYAIAKDVVVINDLHRHWLASLSYRIAAPLFFPNRLIFYDGLLSIRHGFKWCDWESYLLQAEIPGHQIAISWNWAFRWIITIDKRIK